MKCVERGHIRKVFESCGWNQGKAAEILGIHGNTLRRKLEEFGMTPPPARPSHRPRREHRSPLPGLPGRTCRAPDHPGICGGPSRHAARPNGRATPTAERAALSRPIAGTPPGTRGTA
ncbi:MAG: helix-turn-helix domain-containing protein [Clostridia bacterium]